MKSFVLWEDRIVDKDKNPVVTYDVAFKPDGSQIIVATGSYVLVYDSASGNLVQTLRSHKDLVFAVRYSFDGKIFASGSADKTVIIWDSKTFEGLIKYSHNDILQSLAFNPQTSLLASCSVGDFALWYQDNNKPMTKIKMGGRILCSDWSSDGQFLALGTFSGIVSIRNRAGDELKKIDRGMESPVWCLAFNPKNVKILVVGDWGQKLSFHDITTGNSAGKDRLLDYDPCFISFFSNGEYMLIGGSSRKAILYNHEGIQLGTVCEKKNGWLLGGRVRNDKNQCVVSTKDGNVSVHQITFNTVHGLYLNRYAYRESLTDVIIHHLATNQKARIKCRDLVKRISLYKSILAVQLSDRIIIYEQQSTNEMHYRIKEKINKNTDCNLLVSTSCNIVLCMDSRLQMIDFKGQVVREWNLESVIRYIKVVGGPAGRETIFVGLKNGKVFYVYIDSPFPVLLIEHSSAIRCLDLSMYRKKVAIVDENNVCFIYDIKTLQIISQEPHASSVCFNTEYEDMFCYSGDGLLSIKTGSFAPYQQKFKGFVVGFKGSKVYCLNYYNMVTIDLPQTTAMDRYLSQKDFENAYWLASMGVTSNDWKRLGFEALENLRLDIAKQAFSRVRELKYLDLVDAIERLTRQANVNTDVVIAEIHLYEGRFEEVKHDFRLYFVTKIWIRRQGCSKRPDRMAGWLRSIPI